MWNAHNKLASITGGTAGSFQYDPFGRRVGKTTLVGTTNYLYDGVNPVQELAGTTPTANLLSGGLDEVFTRTDAASAGNFLSDALGSTLALTDSTGTIQTQYTYEPFGNTTVTGAPSNNPFQYTGRENDGTGLYFYRARYYSPSLQRFVSEDPAGFYGGGTNLYRYVGNNPTNGTDPSGLWSPEAHDQLIRHALAPCGVSGGDIQALQNASRRFDSATGVSEDWAFAHSMRSPGQSVDDAVARRNDFIAGQLNIARLAWQDGDAQYALSQLAWGLHPIMDFTSPAHTDANGNPITWCGWHGCVNNLRNLSQHSPNDRIGHERTQDITRDVYRLEDQAIRDAYSYVTGQRCEISAWTASGASSATRWESLF